MLDDWRDDWPPIFRALGALARSLQVRDERRELAWLRKFAERGGWLGPDASLDACLNLAAAVQEALKDLHAELPGSPDPDDEEIQPIRIWYERAVNGLTDDQIARRFDVKDNWVKWRSGGLNTNESAWPGLRRVYEVVALAAANELQSEDDGGGAVRLALGRVSPPGRALLVLLALFAPGSDLVPLLRTIRNRWDLVYPPLRDALQTDQAVDQYLAELGRSRLITPNPPEYRIERATARPVRTVVTRDEINTTVDYAVWLLAAAAPSNPVDPDKWERWQLLRRHVEETAPLALEAGCDEEELVDLLDGLGVYLRSRYEVEKAVPWAQKAVDLGERLYGAGHPDTAHLLSNLGYALHGIDEDDQAIERLNEAVRIREERIGPGGFLAGSISMRASVYSSLGRHLEAIADRQRAIDMIGEQEPDHDIVLAELWHNLALDLRAVGRVAEALDAFEAASRFGDGSWMALRAGLVEGALLNEVGRFPDAVRELESIRGALTEHFGWISWDNWDLHRQLALAYDGIGDRAEAERYRKLAVSINDESAELGYGES